jgi:Xaa-Pro aminopeptidase
MNKFRRVLLNNIIQFIIHQFDTLNITLFFINHPIHLRYLTRFTGSSGICILSPDRQCFITDGRYKEQAQKEVTGFDLFFAENSSLLYPTIKDRRLISSQCRVGFESDYVTVASYNFLKNTFSQAEWIPLEQIVEPYRMIKNETELEYLKKAVWITETVFNEILNHIRVGVSESDIAAQIGYLIRKHGGQKEAFDTIVASGPRSALPHATPTDRKFKNGDAIILDFGAVYNGYHADMTRTVFLGAPTDKQKHIYKLVENGLLTAQQYIRPGMPASDVDAHVRNYFKENNYENHFLHSLGHGIGLEIHEAPLIGSTNLKPLIAGQMFTIEPGLYLPGEFGVRIENDILLTEHGAVNLMTVPETLISIPES